MKIINILIRLFKNRILVNTSSKNEPLHTRTINPKMGLLGFFGFLGFIGFLLEGIVAPFPFFFFAFFGFFGFYYEGKMSNTLIDERFKINAYRAEAISNKISLNAIILVAIIVLARVKEIQALLSFLIATIGLAFGLSVFLQQYLLYKFENEEY